MKKLHPFSYEEYVGIIHWIRANYDICKFNDITTESDNFCLIRHDVEFSVDRALQLAEVENALGVTSTYLFQLRNNVYNSLSVQNIYKIRKIKDLGHDIGLHVHCGMINEYSDIKDMIRTDIDILSKITGIDVQVFSFHRPTTNLLMSNIQIDGLINAYGNLYFHAYDSDVPKKLNVKYIADSNHSWKYGYPMHVSHSKLQINFHPFSWTNNGYENVLNFKELLAEKITELTNSISSEIKTFPLELL